MNNDQTRYIPGMCNINQSEIKKRRLVGFVGFGVLVVAMVLFFVFDLPQWSRAILFVPAFVMATGFLQARNKFCVGFAGAGMQHTNESTEKIEDENAKKADAKKARQINTQAFAIATLLTLLLVLTPSSI